MAGGTPPDAVHIDMQMSVLKEHSCKWLMSAYDHIRSHPDIIINGFRAGRHPRGRRCAMGQHVCRAGSPALVGLPCASILSLMH